jgi:hypothetical protein
MRFPQMHFMSHEARLVRLTNRERHLMAVEAAFATANVTLLVRLRTQS